MTGNQQKRKQDITQDRLKTSLGLHFVGTAAFSLSAFASPLPSRMAPFDGSAWEEEDDEAAPPPDVPYYNNFPGKQPPPGGLIDMRTRPGATMVSKVHINTAEG